MLNYFTQGILHLDSSPKGSCWSLAKPLIPKGTIHLQWRLVYMAMAPKIHVAHLEPWTGEGFGLREMKGNPADQ